MKKLFVFILAVGLLAFVWQIVNRLSADAIGMAMGVLFGVMAGVPAALLVMASGRRREERAEQQARPPSPYALPAHSQAPVIVLAGNGYPMQQPPQPGGYAPDYPPAYGRQPALPGPAQAHGRQFKVVGEKEEWVDEW
ncbi:MAG: hypothetical protein H6642_18230 [Caldilineaceae bacterium]|nr:hypothetical protein [Caldilineaceae bacterium]MCB9140282.1 hypothetical protein [Caldilineaceae bacterium]